MFMLPVEWELQASLISAHDFAVEIVPRIARGVIMPRICRSSMFQCTRPYLLQLSVDYGFLRVLLLGAVSFLIHIHVFYTQLAFKYTS